MGAVAFLLIVIVIIPGLMQTFIESGKYQKCMDKMDNFIGNCNADEKSKCENEF